MAAAVVAAEEAPEPGKGILPPPAAASLPVEPPEKLLSTYIGVSFAVFLGFLPRAAISYVPCLQARNRVLSLKMLQAEDQLRQMRSRRHEDSKANARVVEIFASHRNAWQQEERRLLAQIDAAADEIAALRKKVEEMEAAEAELRAEAERLRREVGERDEVIDFMSRKVEDGCGDGEDFAEKEVEIGAYGSDIGGDFNRGFEDGRGVIGDYVSDFSTLGKTRGSEVRSPVPEVCFYDRNGNLEEVSSLYSEQNGFSREILLSASKSWTERSNAWQDFQYESVGSLYPTKHFVARRESPWKVDCDSTGVSAKLKLLERELVNLEKLGSGELSKVPSLMRKQAKRYQSLAGKIDDLCRRMQVSDPSEPTLGLEFRTQRQTEFLLEAFRLQHRATETRQKLTALHTETAKNTMGDDLSGQAKLNTRKSLDLIKSNFKEIQRNLEIWLARIMGDLEGILARNGVSHVKDYCISTYPLVG